MRGSLALWALVCGLFGGVQPARAQDSEPLRVLILEGPTPDWVRRVRGQLSDLPVAIATLALVVEGQPQSVLARQLAPLAEHRDAALVAWLGSATTGANESVGRTEVAIWFARSGRFFERPLGARWSALSPADRSAALELAALSVRSAVRSLLLDPSQTQPPGANSTGAARGAGSAASSGAASSGAQGSSPANSSSNTATLSPAVPPSAAAPAVARVEQSAAQPSAPEPVVQPSAPAAAAEAESGAIVVSPAAALAATDEPNIDRSARSADESAGIQLDLSWNAELGVVGQVPGPPAFAAAGAQLGVRARSGAWGGLALGQIGLPLRSTLGPSRVELQQHALLAELQYFAWESGVWSLGALARAGVRFARRETVHSDAALQASAVAWHEALRLGLGGVAEWRWRTHFGASLRAVLHWEPARPTYAVLSTSGDPVASARAWAVQPSLELCGNWYW